MPCKTVTVEEAVNDTSDLYVRSINLSSNNPNEITVDITTKNEIIEGDGEHLSGTVHIELDGSEVETYTVDLSPGATSSKTIQLNDVASGEREVCATVTQGTTY